MEFNYKVETTSAVKPDEATGEMPTAILFQPTDLFIGVENKEIIFDENQQPVEVINVRTVLTQIIPGGYVKQERMHKLPTVILNAIVGFDTATLQPKIDPNGLNQILAGFFLKLAGT